MCECRGEEGPRVEMTLKAVGRVRSPIKDPILRADACSLELQGALEDARRRVRDTADTVSEIEIYPEVADLLDGIEDFSHLLVLYWAHLVPEAGRSLLKVHPIGRKEFPLKGIFATCSPARPNPVLVNASVSCSATRMCCGSPDWRPWTVRPCWTSSPICRCTSRWKIRRFPTG